ncbi:nucleoid-associated protein YejK [Agarivorans sp. DSG3-1]|uniref:nucleoid-associated protein YejK n=1 Tax=Agarivorans sp. DSG3-1 TaxID=3342249 RepID=UPI00398F4478
MSISLKHLILHSLELTEDGTIALQARSEEMAHSEEALSLIEGLHLNYSGRAAKGFGFYNEENNSPFKLQLDALLSEEIDFHRYSVDSGTVLVEELKKYEFIDQGVLLLANYEHVAGEYLLIMLLENKISPAVDDSLELTASRYLETSSVQLAARIDITDMQRNPESQRYVSYVKGRAGRKISDFFVEFLGCDDGLDIKVQNAVLMQAVDDYCQATQLDKEEKLAYKGEVKSYCEQQLKDGEEIVVGELAKALPTAEDTVDFYQFAAENYPLEDQFPADRTALKKLAKCFGQGKGVSVSFEQKLLGDRVFYDESTDTLTIVGVPPNLREQLKNNK